jgi:hypothetical protein
LAISAARIEPTRLGLWSFGAAIAHGAGLMRAPIYLGLCQTDGLQRGDAAASTLLGANFGMAVLVSIVRSGAMIASGGLSAWLVYRYLRAAPEGPEFICYARNARSALPGRLFGQSCERRGAAFVAQYNHARHHESLANLTPAASTSDRLRPSSSNAKGSNDRQSQTVACSTNCMPHNLNSK